MKREILFRGQVKYNGNHLFTWDWVYGSLIVKTGRTFIHVLEEAHLNYIKIIARPLSDLYKEITHNGETFIPIVKIAEMIGCETIKMVNNECQITYMPSGDAYIKETLHFSDGVFYENVVDYYYSSDNVKNYKSAILKNQQKLILKLLEWHFNLMDKEEEFVDVNTLNDNPYK